MESSVIVFIVSLTITWPLRQIFGATMLDALNADQLQQVYGAIVVHWQRWDCGDRVMREQIAGMVGMSATDKPDKPSGAPLTTPYPVSAFRRRSGSPEKGPRR